MKKNILLTLVGILLLVAAIIGIKASQIMDLIAAGKTFQIPPISIQVTEATTQSWADQFDAVGTIESVQGVTLANEVPGKVEKIAFESGSMVAAGDVLVILDKASEEAQLRSAMAAAELANLNLSRTRELRKTSVISQSELDTAESQQKNTTARVEELQWILQKRTIKAPSLAAWAFGKSAKANFFKPARRLFRFNPRPRVCEFLASPTTPLGLECRHESAGHDGCARRASV